MIVKEIAVGQIMDHKDGVPRSLGKLRWGLAIAARKLRLSLGHRTGISYLARTLELRLVGGCVVG